MRPERKPVPFGAGSCFAAASLIVLNQVTHFLAANATLIAVAAGAAWLLALPQGLAKLTEAGSGRWHRAMVHALAVASILLLAPASSILGESAAFASVTSDSRASALALVGFAVPLSVALLWALISLLPAEGPDASRPEPTRRSRRWVKGPIWLMLGLCPALLVTWVWLAAAEYEWLLRLS